MPAYRTETRPKQNGIYKFDPIKMDTDSMCDNNDMQDICF